MKQLTKAKDEFVKAAKSGAMSTYELDLGIQIFNIIPRSRNFGFYIQKMLNAHLEDAKNEREGQE